VCLKKMYFKSSGFTGIYAKDMKSIG